MNTMTEKEAQVFIGKRDSKHDPILLRQLLAILIKHCGERGDNEGAVETLERIVRERNILIANGVKEKLLKLI